MARTDDSLLAKQAEATGRESWVTAVDPTQMALPEPLAAIPVRNESPGQAIPRCLSLSAVNPVLPVLPQDPRRRRAVLVAVDTDVWITGTADLAQAAQGTASGSAGFYLPRGVPLEITAKGAFWAAQTLAPVAVQPGNSTTGQGTQTNPGAFTTIAGTGVLPAGTYRVTATVMLSGTVAAADQSNMRLVAGVTFIGQITYPAIAGTPVTYTAIAVLTAPAAIVVQSGPGAASGVAAVYNASVVADQIAGTPGVSRLSVLVEKDDQ